ncbi:MAG TPA: hypothetical protein VGA18_08115, partial [Rhodothermales bacterium]
AVQIDTSALTGFSGALALDFTSTDTAVNSVTILNFIHDGETDLPETEGGLIQGDIILLLNPAPVTTIEDSFFFNALAVPFTRFGSSISFTLQLTENAPFANNVPPDELSLYLLHRHGGRLFDTADPLGTDALFALCVDGTSAGLLNVFDPAMLIGATIDIVIPPIGIFADGFESGGTSAWSATTP